MKRIVRVVAGFITWVLLDYLFEKQFNPQMALLAAFVVAWCMEGNDK